MALAEALGALPRSPSKLSSRQVVQQHTPIHLPSELCFTNAVPAQVCQTYRLQEIAVGCKPQITWHMTAEQIELKSSKHI